MKIHIKNMVCARCILAIQSISEEIDLTPTSIVLGEVDFSEHPLSPDQLQVFKKRIEALGFELINDKKSQHIEIIKKSIIELINNYELLHQNKLSDYLKDKLHYDYNYLSHLFSSVEGITIEQYQINQKIEKVKELLIYEELTLTEISYQLGYSSVAHLSRQFKKVTGLTSSHFKQMKDARQRLPLDKV
jgi:AraC-like DNA-binding protein